MLFKDVINKVLLYDHTSKVVYGLLGFGFGMLIIGNYMDTKDTYNFARIGLTPIVIFSSLLLTARQFAYNREWNTKDAAINAIYISRDKTSDQNAKINPFLQTNHLVEKGLSLSIVDIHNKMGVFLKDGRFVFHGEQTDNDIKSIHTNNCDYAKDFDSTIPGREIDRAITMILNEYEYICMSCNMGIFDKEVVKQLAGLRIVSTYNVFINYIYHIKYDTRHNYGNDLYIHFENFVKEIVKDDKFHLKIAKKPSEEEYVAPFNSAT